MKQLTLQWLVALGFGIACVAAAPAERDGPAPPAGADAGNGTSRAAPAPPSTAKKPADKKADDSKRPTMAEIQRSHDEGAYEQTIQLIAKVLPIKGPAAAAYSRYDLLMLKADSHIRIRAGGAAAQAFADAADATDDAKAKAKATVLATLVRKSRGLVYTPKGKGKSPISLETAEKRQQALDAYWADELARVKAKVEKAARGRALPPIADAIKEVNGVRIVEMGATGSDEQAKRLGDSLADRGFDLMSKAIKRMAKQVEDIAASADEIERRQIRVQSATGRRPRVIDDERRRGLQPEEERVLRDYVRDAPPIAAAAEQLAQVAGDAARERADDIIDTASDVVENAKRALDKG